MKYKNFTLDKFQEDAIHAIENNHSVVVSAATGTGKTLTADYIIDKAIKENKRVIYTAPIKALSNQKFRDFKEQYGEDKIGILTGDLVINDKAPILIMTTEIYRNMLLEHSIMPDLAYVIFDEIHYMNDPERGTVWEESIIFSPKSIRFLCLSATIPNADKFASWISHIKEHEVVVVSNHKRAVPLKHEFFTDEEGIIDPQKLKKIMQMEKDARNLERRQRKGRKPFVKPMMPDQIALVKQLKKLDYLPNIFFSFSRKLCRDYAVQCEKKLDFTTTQEKTEIGSIFRNIVPSQFRHLKSIQNIRRLTSKGIGIHNAAMLPHAKEYVEVLFAKGLIKVLYATETFAVGINMPARSVCFSSLRKYDGRTFRNIHTKEYYQMAGRAGRRGLDKEGYVFAMIDKAKDDIYKIIELTRGDSEPIISQFSISPNMVLNLVDKYPKDQIEGLLKQNFGYFIKKTENDKQVRIMRSYNNVYRKLKKLNFIDEEDNLTGKGKFASHIYADEILITELLFSGAFNNLSEVEINVLIGTIVYEPRRSDKFKSRKNYKPVKVDMSNKIIQKELNIEDMKNIDWIVRLWSSGADLDSIMEKTSWEEGDIIRFFRQIIDRLGQVRQAESVLTDKLSDCIKLIDRDVVSVLF
jgi:superfamily II RNA helicase